MPSASFIVARSHPGHVIGCENKLPWNLKTDMKRFRKLTEGHVVIMGRKTLESIGRPLPNRKNIVLSKERHSNGDGVEWVSTAQDAIFLADFHSICMGQDTFFVIGGGEIYNIFHKKDLYNRVYLTEIFHDFPNGDSFFPYKFDGRKWSTVEEQDVRASENDQYPFRFVTLDKKSKTIRKRFLSDFMANSGESDAWRERATSALIKWEKEHPPIALKPEVNLELEYKTAV
jgi:dihydrofolate reductase